MEDLSTTQTILLCVLVSFVTSIGTGIITTSFLQEAPQTVTQTINRVVERTVETIVPQQTGGPTRQTTVVVKEEDLVIDAIQKSHGNLVWITNSENRNQSPVRSIGVVVKKDGTILADKRFVLASGSYNAVSFGDQTPYSLSVLAVGRNTNAIFLKPTTVSTTTKAFAPLVLSKPNSIQLGQTVIAIGGKEKESVAIGRIISVNTLPQNSGQATSTKVIDTIETDAALRDGIPGSILLNLNGEIAGFENFDAARGLESIYTSINIIKNENPSFFEPSTI